MPIESAKRKLFGPSPWERESKLPFTRSDDPNDKTNYLEHPGFCRYMDNIYLDINSKRAALKASPFVAGLVSYLGEEILFRGSGFIIESDNARSIILSSADLVRCLFDTTFELHNVKVVAYLSMNRVFEGRILTYDSHYNLAAVEIQSNCLLPAACIKDLDDSISIDPNQAKMTGEKHFQLRSHSNSYKIVPGDEVVALGRYFVKPHNIMAAPGEFCADRSECECKELYVTSCHKTRCGIGGPLINRHGEVIGLSFHDFGCTPFLPINLVMKWWNQYKLNGKTVQPYLGMELTNLHAVRLEILERFILNFPDIFKGVIVEEVVPGSCADSSGISPGDVIVEFAGKTIQSFLELVDVMTDKVGQTVELIVLRASGIRLQLSMVVEAVTRDKIYRWD